MRETWVRGIFFIQVLDYVRTNLGKTSYELLGKELDNYKSHEKYDFADFGELLEKAKLISPGKDDFIAQIGRETMTEEANWKSLFRRMDPVNVFSSTKRQEGRHQLADYEIVESKSGRVVLRMTMWTDKYQDLWADFYRGRQEGILELMGRTGSVKVVREFGNGSFLYTIEWF